MPRIASAKYFKNKIVDIVIAKGLTKDYGYFRTVDNVDFNISQGEYFGFLGPNGAGKTTVMRIVCCFMPPTSGSVRVFDMDVTESPDKIKARIGVMPQDDNIDPDFSVFENLIVYARYFDIPKKKALPVALEALKFLELTEKSNVNIKELSGGMKHRLLLARSLINNPELLVLDEPTTGLDPHSRQTVWEKLKHLKIQGTTLILTTHYTSRPLLLEAVAKQIKHGGQTFLTITSSHAKAEKVKDALLRLSKLLGDIKVAAEQLNIRERMRLIVRHAFRKLIGPFGENSMKLLTQDG